MMDSAVLLQAPCHTESPVAETNQANVQRINIVKQSDARKNECAGK
jgi:hypothetical protein